MNQRNTTIDLAKYIAALLVIAIHTALFYDINDTLYFVTVDIICRMAVPFFAICSGYFLALKWEVSGRFNSDRNKTVFLRQWMKLIVLYLAWSILYLIYSIPSWIDTGWFSFHAFIDYAIGAVRSGSHYHLWYLLSMIYALPLLYACLNVMKVKHLKYLAMILWLVKAASYGYARWMPTPISAIFSLMNVSCLSGAVGILPFLLLGVCISNRKTKSTKMYLLGFTISLTLLCVEAFILRSEGQTAVSYIVFTFPTSYFLFNLIINFKIPQIAISS